MTIIRAPGAEHLEPDQCIRQSMLKVYAQSPRHCWHRFFDPARVDDGTKSTELGTLVHTLLLEPATFGSKYTVAPKIDTRSADGLRQLIRWHLEIARSRNLKDVPSDPDSSSKASELRDLMQRLEALTAPHITLISEDTRQTAHLMRDKVFALPLARELLEHPDGQAEVTILWIDPDTLAPCRATLDWLIPPCQRWPRGAVIDVKITYDASPGAFLGLVDGEARRWFSSHVHAYKYHWQADVYTRAYHAIFGTIPIYGWIAVENKPPHEPALYDASPWMLELAREEYLPHLEDIRSAMMYKQWPGYAATFVSAPKPAWMEKRR